MDDLAKLTHYLRKKFQSILLRHGVSGITVYIEAGQESSAISWGIADVSSQTHMPKDFRFHLGSMIRGVTNHLLLRDVNWRGRLDEIAPFNNTPAYERDQKLATITLRHLLEGSSGLSDVCLLDMAYQNGFDLYSYLTTDIGCLYPPGRLFGKNNFVGLLIADIYKDHVGAELPLNDYFSNLFPGWNFAEGPSAHGWTKDHLFKCNMMQLAQVELERVSPAELDEHFWCTSLSTWTFTIDQLAKLCRILVGESSRPGKRPNTQLIHICGQKSYSRLTEQGLMVDDDGFRYAINDFSAQTVEIKYFDNEDLLIAVGTNSDCRIICTEIISEISRMVTGIREDVPSQAVVCKAIPTGIYQNRLGYQLKVSLADGCYELKLLNTLYFNREDIGAVVRFTVVDGNVTLQHSIPGTSVSVIFDASDDLTAFEVDGDLFVKMGTAEKLSEFNFQIGKANEGLF